MDTESILLLIKMFLRPTYTIKDATDLLGPVKDDTMPFTLNLKPKSPNMDYAQVEYIELEDDERFLTGLFFRFFEPVLISFSDLARQFGEPVMMARLKPHHAIPYRFHLEGYPMLGDIILEVPGTAEGGVRPVQRIRLIRHPPEQEEPEEEEGR